MATEPAPQKEAATAHHHKTRPINVHAPTTRTQPNVPSEPKPPRKQMRTKRHKQISAEIWHQRMGYIGLDTLQKTAKCTTDMKDIGFAHSLFQCQSCQMAKVNKAPCSPTENRPVSRRGERFHMDFGFFREPKHLTDLTTRTWHDKRQLAGQEPTDYQSIIISRDGYSSYLLVVDAFTRAFFVFLTKSKKKNQQQPSPCSSRNMK